MSMPRAEVAATLARILPADHVVVVSLGTFRRAWLDVASPHPTYPASDPMGLASAMALGVALARPERQVWLFAGDGELVMGLSALPAIAEAHPGNLRMVVAVNRRYETGGGRPLAAADVLDVAAVAGGAGIPTTRAVTEPTGLEAAVSQLIAMPGPSLLTVEVAPEPSSYPASDEDPPQVAIGWQFRRALDGEAG